MAGAVKAHVVFVPIHDRRGRSILSVRDQATFEPSYRRRRLMTLVHLYLVHRYKAASLQYVSPTEDSRVQTERMAAQGIYERVHTEVGDIIVADVGANRVAELLAPDRVALDALIAKVG